MIHPIEDGTRERIYVRRYFGNPFILPYARNTKYGVWFKDAKQRWHLYVQSQFVMAYIPRGKDRSEYTECLRKAHVAGCGSTFSDKYILITLNHPLSSRSKNRKHICVHCYYAWRRTMIATGRDEELRAYRVKITERLRYLKKREKQKRENPPETPWYDQ